MEKQYDVLAAGIAAVDDLKYVTDYPPIDCKIPVHGSTRQGGGPACTATAAAGTLGGRAAYVARFGDGELARYMVSVLEQHGVDTSHIVNFPGGGPYHSIIVVDHLGHRNVFYDPALYKTVGPEDMPDSLIQSASLVLLDHITDPALTPVAEKARRLGVPVLGDLEGETESSRPMAALTDYLVVPRHWAAWATDSENPLESCGALAQTKRRATVVTNGVEGCYFSTPSHPSVRHVPAFKVEAFDTNGCGDTFHGAFALAVARHLSVEDAITFGSAAAALKAMAAGGKRRGWDALPTLDAVREFLGVRIEGPEKPALLKRLEVLGNRK
jgi:sugar/nucleoside kinase (ribokinase family)